MTDNEIRAPVGVAPHPRGTEALPLHDGVGHLHRGLDGHPGPGLRGLQVVDRGPSAIFANAVATFPSYWLNRRWAWGKSGRSHFMKEIVPFWAMSAAGIAFSIFFAYGAKDSAAPST